MMTTLSFTKKAANDLAKAYATPDMIAQRRSVESFLELSDGEAVIDIGCGPGFLCETMAASVGPKGRVLGIDISSDLIEIGRDRSPPEHLSYAEEDALNLSAADNSFDVAVCTQVAEYIPDTVTLFSEIYRVLRPGGRALVMATDWDCLACFSENPDRMNRILKAWEEHCAHPRLPRVMRPLMSERGFVGTQVNMHPLINQSFDRNTYSYGLAKLMRDFVTKTGISTDEAEAWFEELTRLDAAGRYYFASARMIFTAQKPA